MTLHTLRLTGWVPASVNSLFGHWARRQRKKRFDRDMVALEALAQAVPMATGKRRVTVRIEVSGRAGVPDPDNVLKSLLDALVRSGLLVDDSGDWCELAGVTVTRGQQTVTVVTLEDV